MRLVAFRKVLLAAALSLSLFGGSARAEEVARLDIFGLSPDGKRFAMMQSGVEDGSGEVFADLIVSEIFRSSQRNIVTPLIPSSQDYTRSGEAPDAVRKRSDTILEQLGFQVAPSRVTSLERPPPARASSAINQMPDGRVVSVEIRPHPARLDVCEERGVSAAGLDVLIAITGSIPVPISVDPDSMSLGCPLRYAVAWLEAARAADGDIAVAVVISYERLGFEGPETRYFTISRKL
jgi:predicted secreted protein